MMNTRLFSPLVLCVLALALLPLALVDASSHNGAAAGVSRGAPGTCDRNCCMNCAHHYSVCCSDPNGNYYCSPGGCDSGDLVLRFPSSKPSQAPINWADLTQVTLSELPPSAFVNATAEDMSQIPNLACAGFSAAQLSALSSSAFEGFNPEQTASIVPEALTALTAEDVGFIQPFSFGIWTSFQIAAIPVPSCAGIIREQMWTVQNSSCSGFSAACIAQMPASVQQGDCFPIPGPQWALQSYSQAVMMGIYMDSKRQTGYISGGDNGVGATVVQTTDGGQTWNQLPIHQPALMFTSFAGSEDPFGMVANGIGLVGFGGTQYAVAGGSKFTNSSEVYEQYGSVDYQQSQDVQPVQGAPGAFGVVGVFGFWKMNASEHLNMLAMSDDNGATFSFISVQNSLSDTTVHLRYCSFPSPSVGFIAAGKWPTSGLVKTLPDGSEVRQLSRFVELHTHTATKKVSLRAARRAEEKPSNGNGNVAILLRSTDGFQTWQQVFFNDTFYPNAISCPSELVCFAAAENDNYGYILGTQDGGDTWQILETAWFTSMFAARAVSETEFFIGGGILSSAGIIGTVWHSTDGGQTFQRQQVDGQYFLNMQFFGSDSAVAVASDASGNGSLLYYGSSE